MENFTFYSPTYFVFGKETEKQTGAYVKKYGGHKVLIHYGGGSVVRSGLLDRVKKSLDEEGIEYVELGLCPCAGRRLRDGFRKRHRVGSRV